MAVFSKLSHRLIALFAVLGLACMTLISLAMLHQLRKERMQHIEFNLNSQLHQIDFVIRDFFANVGANVKVLSDNEMIRTQYSSLFTNFTAADEDSFVYDIGTTEQSIIRILKAYQDNYLYINSVYMGREDGSFVRSRKRARPTRYDPRLRPWYRLAKSNPDRVMQTAPYRSVTTNDINIGTVKALVDETGRVFGVVGMDVTLDDLTRFITRTRLSHQGGVILLDREGQVLASEWRRVPRTGVRNLLPAGARTILESKAGSSVSQGLLGNVHVCHITSESLGWKIVAVTPMEVIDGEIWAFSLRVLGVVLALGLLVSLLTLYWLQRFIVGPVRRLSDRAEDIARTGDLSGRVVIDANDEIGRLGRAFNHMVFRLGKTKGELRRHSKQLEEQVDNRTRELRLKNEALQAEMEQRRQAERDLSFQEANLEQFFLTSPEAIVLIDDNDLVQRINPEFVTMFGYEAEEIIGRSLEETIIPRLRHKESRSIKKRILEGRRMAVETRRTHKEGHLMDVSVVGTPVWFEQDRQGFFIVYRNISDRKNLEMDLVRAMAEAEAANRAKSDFLANMSHEIRTPMNAVIGLTHLALRTELTGRQRDYLTKIEAAAGSLLGIINDILDFSKIEAGKLTMESTDFSLDEVLDNLAALVNVRTVDKSIEVLFQTGPHIPDGLIGDPLRLGQVLINLTNNAVKFTSKGTIVITTDLVERRGKRVKLRFSVRDSGIGMTPEQMDSLFTAFSQADTSTTRQYGGTGLGLSICRSLVEMMKGRIWAESEPGCGSEFSFTAVFGISTTQPVSRFRPDIDLMGMNVLIIDDQPQTLEVMTHLMESFSFHVIQALSGQEGLAELERADPNRPIRLVMLDFRMPGLNGLETAERIMAMTGPAGRPRIIMITAYPEDSLFQRAEKAGVDACLTKPVRRSELFNTIMNCFGRQTLEVKVRGGAETRSGGRRSLKGARVLLVEDNEINRQVASELLLQAGLMVTGVTNGRQAVQVLESESFDAVLMDIQMPEMDGLAATRIIRGKLGLTGLPVIAMTAHAMAGDRKKSLAAGMNDHLTKPIDPAGLLDTLTRWIAPEALRARAATGSGPSTGTDTGAAEPEAAERLDGVDVKSGLARVGGNRALYHSLLVKFREGQVHAARDIRSALVRGDEKAARSLAHTLKGVAANLGATDLQVTALEVEKLIGLGLGVDGDVLDHLDAQLARVMTALAGLEAEEPDGGVDTESREADPEALNPLLKELARLVAAHDSRAQKAFDSLAALSLPLGLRPKIRTLGEHLEAFDFESAMEELQSLIDRPDTPKRSK